MALPAYLPSPPINSFHIGPLDVHFYALAYLVGIAIAVILTRYRWRAVGGDPELVGEIALWVVPAGIIGGRIYFDITTPMDIPHVWYGPFAVWSGGLGIWGGVLVGGLVGIWRLRRRGVSPALFADAMAPGLLIAQGVGRIGNYFNKELFGRPTSLPWGLKVNAMDGGQALRGPDGAPLAYDTLYPDRLYHPTFLYESLWCVGVAVLVWQVDRRFKLGRGRAFALYVMAYTAGRAWIEALRIDDANRLLGLRVNDWVSLLVFLAALVYFVRVRGPQQRLSVAEDGTVTVLDHGGADQPVPAGEPATEPEAAVAAEPDLDPPGTGDPDPAEPEAAGADAPPGDPASPGEADPPERRQPSAVPK